MAWHSERLPEGTVKTWPLNDTQQVRGGGVVGCTCMFAPQKTRFFFEQFEEFNIWFFTS